MSSLVRLLILAAVICAAAATRQRCTHEVYGLNKGIPYPGYVVKVETLIKPHQRNARIDLTNVCPWSRIKSVDLTVCDYSLLPPSIIISYNYQTIDIKRRGSLLGTATVTALVGCQYPPIQSGIEASQFNRLIESQQSSQAARSSLAAQTSLAAQSAQATLAARAAQRANQAAHTLEAVQVGQGIQAARDAQLATAQAASESRAQAESLAQAANLAQAASVMQAASQMQVSSHAHAASEAHSASQAQASSQAEAAKARSFQTSRLFRVTIAEDAN